MAPRNRGYPAQCSVELAKDVIARIESNFRGRSSLGLVDGNRVTDAKRKLLSIGK